MEFTNWSFELRFIYETALTPSLFFLCFLPPSRRLPPVRRRRPPGRPRAAPRPNPPRAPPVSPKTARPSFSYARHAPPPSSARAVTVSTSVPFRVVAPLPSPPLKPSQSIREPNSISPLCFTLSRAEPSSPSPKLASSLPSPWPLSSTHRGTPPSAPTMPKSSARRLSSCPPEAPRPGHRRPATPERRRR